jgi:hypothetical protein
VAPANGGIEGVGWEGWLTNVAYRETFVVHLVTNLSLWRRNVNDPLDPTP